jgi:hypothetical protein
MTRRRLCDTLGLVGWGMPGRKADPRQHEGLNRFGPRIGGRCLVGDDVPAPHRLTIRLSESQWQQLTLAAGELRKPLAAAARWLLGNGAAAYLANPKGGDEARKPKARSSKTRQGRAAASAKRPAAR